MKVLRCATLALVTVATTAAAEADDTSRAGRGSVSVSYQYIYSNGFEGTQGKVNTGPMDTHTVDIDIDWHLTDRLTLLAGIPYIWERYKGDFPHDPLALDPPRPEVENVDQGDWSHSFQDLRIGLSYLLLETPLVVEPFVVAGTPSNDYPFFGHAAIGRNRSQIGVGSTFLYTPPLSDWYFRLDTSYIFVEKTLGVSVNHWDLAGEYGWFFSEQLTGRVFGLYRDGDGLDFPDDFPPPRTDEFWYQHDRMVRHNFTTVGIGLDWYRANGYGFSVSLMTMTRALQVHRMKYAVTVGLTRAF